MNMNFRKTLYLVALTALVAVAAAGLLLLPNNSTVTVSAQENQGVKAETATPEMLRFALNLRSVHNVEVFAREGVLNKGSRINGEAVDAATDSEAGVKGLNDLRLAFDAIKQLPCTEVADTNLGGKSFAPGVYCLSSARLAGELSLDAAGNENGTFVFIVKGSLNTEKGSSIALRNGAIAGNVYFLAADSASIAENTSFRGSILAQNSIKAEAGSVVTGRTLSVNGKVALNSSSVDGAGTGILQICKAADVAADLGGGANGLAGDIFTFTVGGQTFSAPVGGCTGPIELTSGANVTIQETLSGNGGRFALVEVNSPTPGPGGNAVQSVNLPARTASVFIREGDITNQTVVNFVNTFAVPAVIEICKRAVLTTGAPATIVPVTDPDVRGFFTFTVDVLPGVSFQVPVGQCSGPIQVLVPTAPAPVPQSGVVRVTEIGREGFVLEAVTTFPGERLNEVRLGEGIVTSPVATAVARGCNTMGGTAAGTGNVNPELPNCLFANPNGGFAEADILEGGAASQTTFNFFNRTAPGVVKVCKIAGPGIPEGTVFRFRVRGIAPTSDAVIIPGVDIERFVDVVAGPAAQGGFCNFVRDEDGDLTRFIIGTNVLVEELRPALTCIPGVVVPAGTTLPTTVLGTTTEPVGPFNTVFTGSTANSCTPAGQPVGGEVRTSRVRFNQQLTGFTPAPAVVGATAPQDVVNPNPNLQPGTDVRGLPFISQAVITARAETNEVEFTNFVFFPALLKICKIAGPGVAVGTPFTFDVTINDVGGLFSGQTNQPLTVSPVTVQAGPAEQGGFCVFAQGPFTPTNTVPANGTFRQGSVVTITERAVAGTQTTAIAGVTGPVTGVNLATRTANMTLGATAPLGTDRRQLFVPVNEIVFTNAATGGGAPIEEPRTAAVQFDFDGDRKADQAIFRPSTGAWWYASSANNGQNRAFSWGFATDKLVPADYDADGKADFAVYREGIWHIQGSTAGYKAIQFGLATDIPQAGDFDGDGKADAAVFRPSNGIWYMLGSRDGFSAVQFGMATDKTVAADYDGDGKTDPAVFRSGTWYILGSKDGFSSIQFGFATDIPVAADYDGDKKADVAVYRGGMWYMNRSQAGFTAVTFGLATDRPVAADYNGDGKADVAVYRSGMWYSLPSGNSDAAMQSVSLGDANDIPLASR